jgi:ABC-2 type transport system ATP-binding protein
MLEIRHLEKIFAGHCALSIETLDVDAGEIVAVVGPTGCGKTLFINILAGAVPASGGSMLLDGQSIHRRASGVSLPVEARLPLGVLFADDLLYERHTVRGNLEFSCRWSRLPLSSAGDMLKQVGLSDQAQQAVARLSPPAKRRLAFARALLGHPRLLLMDQPTLRADSETQAVFARLLQEAAADGSLVLFTEEDLTWAGSWCSRAIELQDGHVAERLVMSGSPDMPGSVPEKLAPFRVPARREDRIMLYDPAEILYATSRDGKTYLRTAREEALTNLTLQELEARLGGRGFFKAHRAYLVNLQHVTAVIQYTRNSYSLQLDDGGQADIPLSKQSERALHDLLGY